MHRRRHRLRARNRARAADGSWLVRARVERLGEAAVLALLAERPAHGYELLAEVPHLLAEDRVDVGNLYRLLRAMEEEGLVTSEWHAELPGPAKRTYAITDDGRALLAAWRDALTLLRVELDALGRRLSRPSEEGGDDVQ